MPTYDYLCKACGREFSQMQSMSAPPLDTCQFDDCKAVGRVERLLGGGAGLIFKGSGFYITDYKGDKGAAQSPSKAGGEGGGSGGESTGGSGEGSASTKSSGSGGESATKASDNSGAGSASSSKAESSGGSSSSSSKSNGGGSTNGA